MDDSSIAAMLAAGLSVLIGVIELISRSRAGFRACWNGSAFVYLVILMFGNTATTLLAAATTGQFFTNDTKAKGTSSVQTPEGGGPPSPNPSPPVPFKLTIPWFWYAFLGVFGFEALLKNINVTFSDKGVLTINEWISKARDSAVAATIAAQTNAGFDRAQELAIQLEKLPAEQPNAHIVTILGQDRLAELQLTAQTAGAPPSMVLALALANEAPDRAAAITNAAAKAAKDAAGRGNRNDHSPGR